MANYIPPVIFGYQCIFCNKYTGHGECPNNNCNNAITFDSYIYEDILCNGCQINIKILHRENIRSYIKWEGCGHITHGYGKFICAHCLMNIKDFGCNHIVRKIIDGIEVETECGSREYSCEYTTLSPVFVFI